MKQITYEANIHFKIIAEIDTENSITKEEMDEMLKELLESEISKKDLYELEISSTMEVI